MRCGVQYDDALTDKGLCAHVVRVDVLCVDGQLLVVMLSLVSVV